ncbi:MAG: amidohydrolase [Xanthomonadales bacterium]|jgi:predicted amidohydrolase|nr:amidohydrolase [Xanthomonadales bacterium]MDH3925945.1 amidohydrolase [Xanthomonadales bacterium]MDH3941243.1 amidohydrolase [Xanthomonadales bacterium]
MTEMNVLLVQAQLGWKNPSRNREHLQTLLAGVEGPFDIAVFPETFTTGFLGDSNLPDEDMNGATVKWMQEMARLHDCAVTGSAVIVEHGERFNRMIFVTPDGALNWYDKRHLFAFGGENRRYTAGSDRVIVEYRGWRINLQVCYDLRFPAWCRNRDDYDLMILVANWPAKRVHHWSVLLEARAIENQSWVVAVNRVGDDGNGLHYPGSSVVHDPMGARVAELGSEESCRIVKLDRLHLEEVRKQFPFQQDADQFII